MRCRAGRELPATQYRDRRGRPKRVRYWLMHEEGGTFKPNGEVDKIRWVSLKRAEVLLTYAHDRKILDGLPTVAA